MSIKKCNKIIIQLKEIYLNFY